MSRIAGALRTVVTTIVHVLNVIGTAVVSVVTLPFRVIGRLLGRPRRRTRSG